MQRVTVYPSDFGLARMKEEAIHGPLAAFGAAPGAVAKGTAFDDGKGRNAAGKGRKGPPVNSSKPPPVKKGRGGIDSASDSDSESEEDDAAAEEEDPDATRERMRLYERDRMRYYYAVVEFDSVNTAHAVYKECDGQGITPTSHCSQERNTPLPRGILACVAVGSGIVDVCTELPVSEVS